MDRWGRFYGIGALLAGIFLWSCSDRSASRLPSGEGMVVVPGGAFIMGSDKVDTDGLGVQIGLVRPLYEDEHPQRRIDLHPFQIDRFEVTQEEYALFVDKTGSRPPPHWPDGRVPAGRGKHPVRFVSWYDARQYCQWAGKRLPTEAEWEKAARGTNGSEYPWGDTFEPDRGNTGDSDLNDTVPVGSFESGRSPYGVDDLMGNVGEWVEDWFKPYPGNPQTSPLFGERFKVIRGGSWGGGGGHFALSIFYRSAHRLFGNPLERYPDIGFRCARSR